MPSHYIDAAFRSTLKSQVYMFVKKNHLVLETSYGGQKKIIKGPTHISHWIPRLAKTSFENVIDCAFTTIGTEAFIFSGNHCAKIDYAPHASNPKLLIGSIPITAMFPYLSETIFENGIDAAIRSKGNHVFLFKGDQYALIDYQSEELISQQSIGKYFGSFVGTVFEYGIDAAFSTPIEDETYIFKGEYYARIQFFLKADSDQICEGRIKRIKDDWPTFDEILPNSI